MSPELDPALTAAFVTAVVAVYLEADFPPRIVECAELFGT